MDACSIIVLNVKRSFMAKSYFENRNLCRLQRFIESKPPIADAGADVSLQLPRDSVKLDGSKSTDDVGIVTYQWEQVSGGDVKMKGRKTAVLNLNGLQTGTYNFTLTVFDVDGQSDKDGVTVIVKGIFSYYKSTQN